MWGESDSVFEEIKNTETTLQQLKEMNQSSNMRNIEIPSNAVKVTIELPDGTTVVHDKTVPSILWKAKVGESYYYLASDASYLYRMYEGDSEFNSYALGRTYPTHELAEAARTRTINKWKIARRIAELNNGYEYPDLEFQVSGSKLSYDSGMVCYGPKELRMRNNKVAKQIIQEFGVETIIDALFTLS